MSDQQPGLRFDIYERVHLPEERFDICELDEVELSPQIRVAVEGDQATIKGSLLLTGTYTGQANDDVRGEQSLSHTIPVEITLPMSRIRRVEDITVEIDNFDVDLLSARSLNITGVLSLNGIEMASASDVWKEEEEIVFVHEKPVAEDGTASRAGQLQQLEQLPQLEQPPQLQYQQPEKQPEPPPQSQPDWSVPSVASMPVGAFSRLPASSQPAQPEAAPSARDQPERSASPTSGGAKRDEQLSGDNLEDYELIDKYDELSADSESAAEPGPGGPPPSPVETDLWAESAASPEEGGADGEPPTLASDAEEREKGEMKIAFGSKRAEAAFDLKSVLGKSDSRSAEEASAVANRSEAGGAAAVEAEEPAADNPDALEWKSLFITSQEEQPFRRVRLCIVHKDDTVDSIAQKYDLKPQEIRLYNGLSDQELTEGQVIYIP